MTILDPGCALIVIDLQKGLAGALPASIWNEVVERSLALVRAFRGRQRPVVIVTANGRAPGRTERDRRFDVPAGFADPIDEFDPQPDDVFIVKQTWGAFTRSDLEARLKAAGITHVVIVGVATSIGVESTARQAYEAGFNVSLAIDAMADPSREAHDHSTASIFPRLGETGLAADIVALLAGHDPRTSA